MIIGFGMLLLDDPDPPWIGWTRSAMDVHSHLLTPDCDDAHVGATTVF